MKDMMFLIVMMILSWSLGSVCSEWALHIISWK